MAIFLTPDKISALCGVTVKQFFLTEHNPNKIALPPKMSGDYGGVTVHNTDIIKVSGTTMAEQYTRATYNDRMKNVRVHFYTDSTEAWQNLPLTNQGWHAGQNGKPAAHGSEFGNQKTISIECIMGGAAGYEKAEDNAARLAAWLLVQKNLTIDNLYTHNYWVNVRNGRTGTVDHLNTLNDGYKGCPIYIRPHWYDFKAAVQKYMSALKNEKPPDISENNSENNSENFPVKIIDPALNIRENPGVGNKIVGRITDGGVYTIVATKPLGSSVWGKLKSGAGWINIGEKYCKKL